MAAMASTTDFNQEFQKIFHEKIREISDFLSENQVPKAKKLLQTLQNQVTKNNQILTSYDMLAYKNVIILSRELG